MRDRVIGVTNALKIVTMREKGSEKEVKMFRCDLKIR